MNFKSTFKELSAEMELTRREREIFELLLSGFCRADQIAECLGISVNTVNNHLKNILFKSKCHGKTALIANFLGSVAKEQDAVPAPARQIMILDDERDMTMMLRTYLSTHGFECHTFNDPVSTVSQLKKLKIDVIVADFRMPGMNGDEFLKEIRKAHDHEPKVIFISAHLSASMTNKLLEAGAIAVLEKPFLVTDLLASIFKAINASAEGRLIA